MGRKLVKDKEFDRVANQLRRLIRATLADPDKSLAELAEDIGVTKAQIYSLSGPNRIPGISEVAKAARYYGLKNIPTYLRGEPC